MSDKERLQQALDNIAQLADEVAAPLELSVVDVRFGQQGRKRTLEVTIFRRDGPVSLDHCEQLSRQLEQALEAAVQESGPLVEGAYTLEVQSPGIDRTLKTEREMRIFTGHKVLVQVSDPIDGLGVKFAGTLLGINEGKLLLEQAIAVEPPRKNKDATAAFALTVDVNKLVQIKLHADLPAKPKRNN